MSDGASVSVDQERPPLWRDVRILRVIGQIAFVVVVGGVLWYLWSNLTTNLSRQGLPTGFDYLSQPAGVQIPGADFRSSNTNLEAIQVGIKNTALVSFVGIALATALGILIGIARLSSNWLVRRGAALYVETFRNIPVLVIIIFAFSAIVLRLPQIDDPITAPGVILSVKGLWIPWFMGTGPLTAFLAILGVGIIVAGAIWVWRTRLNERTGTPHHRVLYALGAIVVIGTLGYLATGTPFTITTPVRNNRIVEGGIAMVPEYAALMFALSIYTASHIAEIVRGSILAVPKGQTEAANAVALSAFQRMRYVVLPQAFRIMIPPLANQYLNLTKNSSLGIAIGYAEITQITRQIIANGRPAPQNIALLMLIYLTFSLLISVIANYFNRRLTLVTR